jgi:hypothetical protein
VSHQRSARISSLCQFYTAVEQQKEGGGDFLEFSVLVTLTLGSSQRTGWLFCPGLWPSHSYSGGDISNPLHVWALQTTSVSVPARLFYTELHVTFQLPLKMAWMMM